MANKLPQETPAFTGKAERLIAQSTPRKLARQSAPEGAPNIVLMKPMHFPMYVGALSSRPLFT